MKIILALFILVFLVGCSDKNVINFRPDASLLIPCPPLTKLTEDDNGVVTMGNLLLDDISLAGDYRICQSRLQGWIDSYNEYSSESKSK